MSHDHAHGRHAHDHAHGGQGHAQRAGRASVRRLAVSLALTATVMVAEAVGGWLSGSLALVSDAGHMLTDAAALGLAVAAAWLAARPADARRTFGYRRAEVLAAQLNVGALFVLTCWIAWEAVSRLRHPGEPIQLGAMAVVAGIGLVANLLILLVLNREHSLNARSAFLHVVADTISSVAILAGAGVMALWPGHDWIDPVLSLAIALLILWGSVRLVLEITAILMEAVPPHLDLRLLLGRMACCPGVVAIHDLHVWTISSGLHALSAHVVVSADAMGRNDDILDALKRELRDQFGIDHTTLQIESSGYGHAFELRH